MIIERNYFYSFYSTPSWVNFPKLCAPSKKDAGSRILWRKIRHSISPTIEQQLNNWGAQNQIVHYSPNWCSICQKKLLILCTRSIWAQMLMKLTLCGSEIRKSLTWFRGLAPGSSQFLLLPQLHQKYFKSGQTLPRMILNPWYTR